VNCFIIHECMLDNIKNPKKQGTKTQNRTTRKPRNKYNETKQNQTKNNHKRRRYCWYYQSIHLCIIKQFTHTLNIGILYSNKGLVVDIFSLNKPPHNYINNLKCVEWQRHDDGHYRPKHVVFWPRIQIYLNNSCVIDFIATASLYHTMGMAQFRCWPGHKDNKAFGSV